MDSLFFYQNPRPDPLPNGPLQNLKIAIQPNMSVTGWPTDAGSEALARFKALEDATLMERIQQAGAMVCGSTRMSEFGFGLSGSQAGMAVKTRAADAELVLDFMGESRLAALRAGVCGFKPSYGLVSRYGLVGLIPSMECCGLIAGSFQPIADILKTMAGPDEKDFSLPLETLPDFSPISVDPSEITLGVIAEAQNSLNPKDRRDFADGVKKMEKEGFTIQELSLPDFSLFLVVHQIVGSVEASSCTGRYDSVRYGKRAPGTKNWNEMYLQSRGAAFGLLLKSYLFQGAHFQFDRYPAYEDACRIRGRLMEDMAQFSSRVDFILLPGGTSDGSMKAASLAETYAQFNFTAFANVTGQPALVFPMAPGAASVGFQLTGPRLCDPKLLALGEYLLNRNRKG
jgi:aspartyl-tRNA(Asn)/glutamyl-tRNA(Gln) amidotransferase subunit A